MDKGCKGLKFLIYEVEGLFYLCSENKFADQLAVATDLHLCLLIYAKSRFSDDGAQIMK